MTKQKRVFFYILISVLSVSFSAVTWIANFGWLRAYLMVNTVPFAHAAVFAATNIFASFYIEKCKHLRIVNLLFVATYLLTNLFLPDFGDGASGYFFFGLIKDGRFVTAASVFSVILFAVHLILFAVQTVMMINCFIKEKREKR